MRSLQNLGCVGPLNVQEAISAGPGTAFPRVAPILTAAHYRCYTFCTVFVCLFSILCVIVRVVYGAASFDRHRSFPATCTYACLTVICTKMIIEWLNKLSLSVSLSLSLCPSPADIPLAK